MTLFPNSNRLLLGVCAAAVLLLSCSGGPALSNSDLRDAVSAMEEGAELPVGVTGEGDRLRVEVHHGLSESEAVALVEGVGGIVEGASPGLVQALIPYRELADLESRPGVDFLRPPLPIDIPETDSGEKG